MNEPRKAGRPRKHPAEEFHFQTSDNSFVADASPTEEDTDQTGTIVVETQPSIPVVIQDGDPENPALNVNITKTVDVIDVQGQESPDKIMQEREEMDSVVSPIEEKIHKMIEYQHEKMKEEIAQNIFSDTDLNGWRNLVADDHPSSLPPRNGMPILLSNVMNGDGVVAFWKKTRAFANATKRWEEAGKWCDFMTGVPISFEPKFWRERYVS